tara:strand:- start:44 stop:322 length:279 start_codon:yes stop_codon:yes gene_type:complete
MSVKENILSCAEACDSLNRNKIEIIKDLDSPAGEKVLATYGGSYVVISYSLFVKETAMFPSDKEGKVSSYMEMSSSKSNILDFIINFNSLVM